MEVLSLAKHNCH